MSGWRAPARATLRRLSPAWGLAGLLALAACGTVATTPPAAQAPAAPVAPAAPQQGPAKVALLLPLSGQDASLGRGMLDAAQLALFDAGGKTMTLLPRDTKGNPAQAVAAAHDAVSNGAQLILGPLLSGDVAAVGPVAATGDANVIGFTNDATVAGNNVYIMGLTPGDQVNRVVGYAKSQGAHNFAALIPRGAYGDAVAAAFTQAVQAAGGTQVDVERFSADGSDAGAAIQALTQSGASAKPNIRFDALLLPMGGELLRVVVPQLTTAGVDPQQVHLLGTYLWDDPNLGQDPSMVGAWFAGPDPALRTDFEARFQALYGHPPPRLAGLAYDATALAASLAGSGSFDKTALGNQAGFSGLDGLFRFGPNGVVQRQLAVLQVTQTGSKVVDPAPTSFAPLTQ